MLNEAAIYTIRQQLSLNDTPSTWSYDDRQRYNKTLAAYEAANPGSFDGADLATIDRIYAKPTDQLSDTSFLGSVGDFGNAFLDQVVEKTDLGFGALKNTLYIAAAVGIAAFVIVRYGKK